jgi:hypothetical protein
LFNQAFARRAVAIMLWRWGSRAAKAFWFTIGRFPQKQHRVQNVALLGLDLAVLALEVAAAVGRL